MTTEDAGALFDVDDLVADEPTRAKLGRVERALMLSIAAGSKAGTVVDEDAGLAAAALAAARSIDAAELLGWRGGTKAGYLIAQLLTPYREALQALRLPAEVVPTGPPAPAPAGDGAPSWLHDGFGTAE